MPTDRQEQAEEHKGKEGQRVRIKKSEFGRDYYQELGKRGGTRLKEKIGPSGFRQLGLKGGAATKQRYGPDHYRKIGQQGGLQKGKNHSGSAS